MFATRAVTAVAVLVAAVLVLLPQGVPAPSNLIDIQSMDDYELWSNDTKHKRCALIYFFATWSPVCKQFLQEYKKVAQAFQAKEYMESFLVTKMDGPNYPRVSRSLGIEAFPHILLFSADEYGKHEQYTGELQSGALIKWVTERVHRKMERDGKPIPKKKVKKGLI
jgi:thioredoxin-like negative regulator of GroEL